MPSSAIAANAPVSSKLLTPSVMPPSASGWMQSMAGRKVVIPRSCAYWNPSAGVMAVMQRTAAILTERVIASRIVTALLASALSQLLTGVPSS